MRREVFFVLVAYGEAHRDAALATLRRFVRRHFPGAAPAGVVVDNALDGRVELELDGATTCISGDNTWREFSGWDRGLGWLDAVYAPRPESALLLANDTVQRAHWREYLEGTDSARVREALARGGLCGKTDAYPREVELFGLRVQRWLRSAFMVATATVVDRLRPFALPFAERQIFASDPLELFRRPSPLDANYQGYLRSWLLGEPGELQSRWHAAAPLSSGNAAELRGKARAILCEHHLSARASALGLPLVDGR